MRFPSAIDEHKRGKPRVPTSFGIFYVFGSILYLFTLTSLQIMPDRALAMASCILLGGFLGLVDDLMDLRWRVKAVIPIMASLPLIALRWGDTLMATYFFGKIDFGIFYYILVIPLIVTVTTNAINMLGGLNGLETLGSLIVMVGLAIASSQYILLIIPIVSLAILAYYNFSGRIFVGNVGTFSFGITLAAYTIIMNIEQTLLISLTPFIINSLLILLSFFLLREKADTYMTQDNRLHSKKVRSLRSLILHYKPLTERQCVALICTLILISTIIGILTAIPL
jgi:UDP-N-acetylglucosamine--dolichyl-phosphate N-acetylglucosaminephosphotransferase